MATLKFKDIEKMDKKDKEIKIKELKMELIKSRAENQKAGSSKVKNLKKMIAKMFTLNTKHGNMSKMWLA
jgi:ribosomal protein L29